MQSYSSPFYHTKGPDILVRFYVSENAICHVDLSLNSQTELAWQIYSDGNYIETEKKIQAWMESYAQKRQPDILLPLLLKGLTPFTLKILDKLTQIPFGCSSNYKQIATEVGKPSGARAVGNACGRNPFPLIIPCHRVLTSKSSLGGFSCGEEIKERLLQFENINFIS